MSDKSAIQWTDATWNPTTGCTKVSPGCAHCYIERTPAFRIAGRKFVNGSTDLRLHADRLEQPLRWRKPRRVFVNSLSDLFHPDVPDEFIDRVFAVMAMAERHTFQVLTKRADRMRQYLSDRETPLRVYREFALLPGFDRVVWRGLPLPNVWLGVSVENQRQAAARIPHLLNTPAAVRFISAEPLLEPVDLRHLDTAPELLLDALSGVEIMGEEPGQGPSLDWVIVGGESGPGARPFAIEWARSIIAQCRALRCPCFVKQLGARPTWGGRPVGYYEGQDWRDRKGGDPAEWPDDLRVREFPEARA